MENATNQNPIVRDVYKTRNDWKRKYYQAKTFIIGMTILNIIFGWLLWSQAKAYTELQQKQGIGRDVTIIKGGK